MFDTWVKFGLGKHLCQISVISSPKRTSNVQHQYKVMSTARFAHSHRDNPGWYRVLSVAGMPKLKLEPSPLEQQSCQGSKYNPALIVQDP